MVLSRNDLATLPKMYVEKRFSLPSPKVLCAAEREVPKLFEDYGSRNKARAGTDLAEWPSSKHFIPVSVTLGFAGLEILVPKRRLLLREIEQGFSC